jgi:hypothetical protein
MSLLGSTITFSAQVFDKDPTNGGVLVNAQTVTLDISVPDGNNTVVSATVTNPPAVTGQYTVNYIPTTYAGRYVGLWTITMVSGFVAKFSQVFEVSSTDPGYLLSLKGAKEHLNIPLTDTTQDNEILSWIAAISDIVDYYCGACIPRTVVEYQNTRTVMFLQVTPVISIQSIVPFLAYGRSYAPAELAWTPDGRVQLTNRWQFQYPPYMVTYVAGRLSIPASLIEAIKIILQHFWATQRGASSLPFQAQDTENVPVGMGYLVPNRALELMKATDLGPSVG